MGTVSVLAQDTKTGDASNAMVTQDLGAPVFVPPAPKPKPPQFEAIETHEGETNGKPLIVHRVKAPDLPSTLFENNDTAPNPDSENSPVPAPQEPQIQPAFITVASTTYNGSITRLLWSCEGKTYEGWSNVDFDLLEAITSFQSHGVSYNCIMLHSRAEAVEDSAFPWHPELPSDDTAFVITKGDENDDEAIRPMMALHEVAVAEEEYLAVLAELRKEYREDRKKWLEENPPKTNRVTIQYWPGKNSDRSTK